MGIHNMGRNFIRNIALKVAKLDSATAKVLERKDPLSIYVPGITGFVPSINKLEICYAPIVQGANKNSSSTLIEYITSGKLYELAKKKPYVEFLIRSTPRIHPRIAAFYAHEKTSVILLKGLTQEEIEETIEFLCNTNDGKYQPISRRIKTFRPENIDGLTRQIPWDPVTGPVKWSP